MFRGTSVLRLPIPALGAVLTLLAAGDSVEGDPISARQVALEGDPGANIVARTTDSRGQVQFTGAEGRYYILLPDAYTLRVPVLARAEVGGSVQTSAPVQPGSNGRAYVMGRDGRRLTLNLDRGSPPVRITLTQGPGRSLP